MNVYKQLGSLANEANSLSSLPSGRHLRKLAFWVLLFLSIGVSSQTISDSKSFLVGKLDNGITYYIVHNESPRGQASFHLIHNIGALAEEPGEYGIAHFIEHLTFQGTKHFPNRSIIDMLERHGVLYGHDINAVTSENHTIYKLDGVPSYDKNFLDSCLMVMADWSYALTLDEKKIDKERSVIIEEIKMRNTSDFKMQNKWSDLMLQGSRYENHDIIGTPEFISTVPAEKIRNFYHRWHRPDLEAVAVVGDFDVKDMEQRVRRILSMVPKATTPCPLLDNEQFSKVPAHDTLRFCDAHSKDVRNNTMIVINRVDEYPASQKHTVEYMRQNVIIRLFNILAGMRARALSLEKGSPLAGAGMRVVPLRRGYFTYQLGGSVKDGDENRALRMLMMSGERLNKMGFSAQELEVGKKLLQAELEKQYKYNTESNTDIEEKIAFAYLEKEPMLSAQDYYQVCTDLLGKLTLQQLNDEMRKWFTGRNRTIVASGAPSDYQITAEDAKQIVESVKTLDYSLFPYEMPKMPQEKPFMEETPRSGKVKKTEKLADVKATKWTLSNGSQVIFKPVPQDKGVVCLRAIRKGGQSVYDVDRLPAAQQAGLWVGSVGVGNLDSQANYEQMRLHNIECSTSINLYSDQMVGKTTPDEAESLFQLIHEYFAAPHLDAKLLSAIKLQAIRANNSNALTDTVSLLRTNYSPRTLLRNMDYYSKVTPELVIQTWRERFGVPSQFTFMITGNISEEEAKSLSEKYLASLKDTSKASASASKWKDRGVRPVPGHSKREVEMNLGRSLATVVVNFNLVDKPDVKDIILCHLLNQIYQSRCMKNIREKEGGVYTINVNSETQSVPTGFFSIVAEFNCSPSDADRLRGKVVDEWNRMLGEGVSQAEFEVVRNHLTKEMLVNGDSAEKWASVLVERYLSNGYALNPIEYQKLISTMSATDVNAFLQRIGKKGNVMEVTFKSK